MIPEGLILLVSVSLAHEAGLKEGSGAELYCGNFLNE